MPGMHKMAKLMQCYPDVGGMDWWEGSYFHPQSPNNGTQWWVGYHTSKDLTTWAWPDPDNDWWLIGHELWQYGPQPKKHDWLKEAYYVVPNPSATGWGRDLTPKGYWYVRFNKRGDQVESAYFPNPQLAAGDVFLKGKGKGSGKGKAKGPWFVGGTAGGPVGKGEPKVIYCFISLEPV